MSAVVRLAVAYAAAAFLFAAANPAYAGAVLGAIRSRGVLVCGVPQGAPGVATATSQGRQVGFHADICRAMAAALFSDAEKVKFVALTNVTRFTAVQSGEVDV